MRTLLGAASAFLVVLLSGCGDARIPAPDEGPTPTPTESTAAPEPRRHVIPDDFPLLDGYPTDEQAEGDDYGRVGPSRDLEPIEPQACGETVPLPDFVDWLRGGWANVEDFRDRQLVLFSDVAEATAYAERVIGLYRDCPKENLDVGSTETVVDYGGLGDGSAVAVTRYFQDFEDGGYPTTAMETTQVVRAGRAVLIATEYGEGGAAQHAVVNGIRQSTDAVRGVVDAMDVFAVEEPSASEMTYPSEPPFGPDGFGQVTLGLSRDLLLALPGVRIVGANDQCDFFEAPGITGGLQPGFGVSWLGVRGDLQTPEGIGEGSTYAEVLAAYPGVEGDPDLVAADPPGFDDRYYRIELWEGRVSAIALMHREQRCAS